MPPQTLTLRQLNRATLARQGLLEPLPGAPIATRVERIGSLQAQHPDWPPFALQTRLPSNEAPVDLVGARQRREVVRASLMRITVHVVSAPDFWPMSTLTLGYRADQFRAMYKLDPATSPLGRRLQAAQPAVLEAMRRGPLRIAEIERILHGEIGGIRVPPNRSLWRHFSGSVPLVLVPFDGEAYGRARYAPAAEWLGPPPAGMDRVAAATHLAARYLGAFGPASVQDMAAYVGRGKGIGRLREGVGRLGDRIVHLRDEAGRELVDLADAPRPPENAEAPPRLLARWDSLLLAYGTRDRARVLPPQHREAVITRNADVLPTFLLDGFVAGTWLPRRGGDGQPEIELRPFRRLAAAERQALDDEAARLLPMLRAGAFARNPGTD